MAVTHECDHPPQASAKPRITSSVIDSAGLSAREIDQAVRDSLATEATIYHLDRALLDRLQPDLILTQELCDVCAVGSREVRTVVGTLTRTPAVVSLEPRSLDEVLGTIVKVGELTGTEQRAREVVAQLRARLEAVERAVAGRTPRRVLTLEWVDPFFVGGHWVPEMVERAGSVDVLGHAGEPSREVSWDEILAAEPEIVVAMPCGFGLERSRSELERACLSREWGRLPAVREGDVFVVDGSSYFNRPGPRLVNGVEILAGILHPEVWSRTPAGSWEQWQDVRTANSG